MIAVPAPGETLCAPPFTAWEETALRNRALLAPFAARRAAMRRAALGAACAYTEQLGLPLPDADAAAPLIMAGHQPSFYHPGVLFKYRLLTEAAARGMAALHLSVDTDPAEGFMLKLPEYEGGAYARAVHYVSPGAVSHLYADAPVCADELAAFVRNALADLASLPGRPFAYGEEFLRSAFSRPLPPMMADASVALRRIYAEEWPQGVLELPLTALCRTAPFFDFAYELIARAPEAATIFNGALAAYRAEHRIRSKANPFPDLDAGSPDEGVETLFWVAKGGVRLPLMAARRGDGVALLLERERTVESAGELQALCAEDEIQLWPRAVALSLLNRLFLADLFVHGVGGAKYDRITDAFIGRFYPVDPPPFAAASATLRLPGLDDPAPGLLSLRQQLREMMFHPEDFLEMRPVALLEQKAELMHRIQQPGADKKSLGQGIAQVNAALGVLLEPAKAALAHRIAAAEKEEARYAALADRELPYFIYSPSLMPHP